MVQEMVDYAGLRMIQGQDGSDCYLQWLRFTGVNKQSSRIMMDICPARRENMICVNIHCPVVLE